VGIETLAAALSEPRDALEEIVEPFLLQQGFIQRTPRGRVMTIQMGSGHAQQSGGLAAAAGVPGRPDRSPAGSPGTHHLG
jgi:Holliday junction DNA helicase RuvB